MIDFWGQSDTLADMHWMNDSVEEGGEGEQFGAGDGGRQRETLGRGVCLTLAFLLFGATALRAQNLASNGDFELPNVGATYLGVAAGVNLWGWTVEDWSVDVIGGYWRAARGNQSLDLSGDQPGGIHQDLVTAPGQTYNLRFAMAGNPDYASVKAMEVWWGNQKLDTLSFDTVGHSRTDMGWAYHSFTVTGSGNDRLRFVSLGWPECYGPTLDDVSVTPVPEPASVSLLALAGAAAMVWRKQVPRQGSRRLL